MGRDSYEPPAEDGGLCFKEAEAWQEGPRGQCRGDQTKEQGEGEGRRQKRPVPRGQLDETCFTPQEPLKSQDAVKVPGAKAPEIDVHRLLNSWPRLLLKCNGDLAGFVQSMLSGDPLLCDEGTPPSVLWPVPLPYPEIFRRGGGDGSFWRKRRLSVQLMVLDWLFLGKPKIAPRTLKLGQKLTSGQWRIVKLLD